MCACEFHSTERGLSRSLRGRTLLAWSLSLINTQPGSTGYRTSNYLVRFPLTHPGQLPDPLGKKETLVHLRGHNRPALECLSPELVFFHYPALNGIRCSLKICLKILQEPSFQENFIPLQEIKDIILAIFCPVSWQESWGGKKRTHCLKFKSQRFSILKILQFYVQRTSALFTGRKIALCAYLKTGDWWQNNVLFNTSILW